MKKKLQENIDYIKAKLGSTEELVTREIEMNGTKCAVIYLMGLSDQTAISKFVITPLSNCKEKIKKIDDLLKSVIFLSEANKESKNEKIILDILKGKAVLIVDGFAEVLLLGADKFKERTITEPPTSSVLKGPREGFVESIKTNLSVMRRILATPKLRTKSLTIGKHSATNITIMYIDTIADNEIVDLVEKRINEINIDGIVDSFYVAGHLEEHKNSMFRQIGNSEKPDVIASKLLEGKVAIFVDGSPMVLTVPFIFMEDLQSGDDYYNNHSRATFVRWIRIFSVFITILTPAIYIAVVLHHYKAIPLKFLITIVNSTKGLPLSPFAEILFVLILFEILYEASLRMPKYLGIALSIMGALILGDTAVKAGLISPPAVLIVAISGLSIYCIPEQSPQLYIMRMLFTLAGGFMGFFGITALMVFFIAYLCDFDSYKSAYLAPIAPFVKNDMKDSLYKTDIVNMKTRPQSFANNKKNNIRKG